MNFDDAVSLFKQNEAPESVVAIIDDAKLRASFLAWKAVKIARNRKGESVPETIESDPAALWNWAWEDFVYDFDDYAAVAGLQIQEVVNQVNRLVGLRLIYPDGSQNSFANQFLKSQIVAQLKKAK